MKTARNTLVVIIVVGVVAGMALADPVDWEMKWSQPPEQVCEFEIEPGIVVPVYSGWDQWSQTPFPIVADDWRCNDPRPVTDAHWWGSYQGWLEPVPPPIRPIAFHIGFWTNVPETDTEPSHPGQLIYQFDCKEFQEVFVGYDTYPCDPGGAQPCDPAFFADTTFQYNQWFDRQNYFDQELGRIYWISIQAVYPAGADPQFPWGWKTRQPVTIDNAVIGWGQAGADGKPEVFYWDPVQCELGFYDMAFELSVPEPGTMALLAVGGALAMLRRRRRA